MFAVPGWNVSATSLIPEKGGKRTKQKKHKTIQSQAELKKRKRELHNDEVEYGLTQADGNHDSENDVNRAAADQRQTKKQRRKQLRVEATDDNSTNWQPSSLQEQENAGETVTNRHSLANQSSKNGSRGRQKTKERSQSAPSSFGMKAKSVDASIPSQTLTPSVQLTPLQAKMRSKLISARFRHLNETLYTSTSAHALDLFGKSPELYNDYHAGFAQQVRGLWPQNPVDDYVKMIKARGQLPEPKPGHEALPRRKTQSCTIADLGCGDAPLARGCQTVLKAMKLKFHNYDLYASNSLVTKADISQLPLRDGEADIAVFCLSLMGTNWISFVEEAWRVLRGDGKGEVWVAEVKSRFGRVTRGRVVDNSVGKRRKKQGRKPDDDQGETVEHANLSHEDEVAEKLSDETDISTFVKVFTRRGFQLYDGSVRKDNKMFVSMIFSKSGIPTAGRHKGMKWTGKEYKRQEDGRKPRFIGNGSRHDEDEVTPEQEAKALKPCVYKIR